MDTSLISLTQLESDLLQRGFVSFTNYQKNQMVDELSKKFGLAYTDITEQYIFEYHKKMKKELMSKVCNNAILTGYKASNGHSYRTNQDDQLNMIAQKEYINSHPELENVKWKTQDSGYIDHTVEEWMTLYYEGFDYKMNILFKYEKIKQLIEQAQNEFELTSLDWDTFESMFSETSPEPEEQTTPPVEETAPTDGDSTTSTDTPSESSEENPTETEPNADEPTTSDSEEPTEEPSEPTTAA